MDYCQFFPTEDQAVAHCRLVNRGLAPKDPKCCAVVDGPGGEYDPEWSPGANEMITANYAVVDLETAKDLLDFGGAGSPTCLIVTD